MFANEGKPKDAQGRRRGMREGSESEVAARRFGMQIRTTRIAGGLLVGYNPWKAGARLKPPAFTLFRPYCP